MKCSAAQWFVPDLQIRGRLFRLGGEEVAHDQLIDEYVFDVAGQQLREAFLVVAGVDEMNTDRAVDFTAVPVATHSRHSPTRIDQAVCFRQ